MPDRDLLTERFETHRSHLQAVAYRMVGSGSEADDAVQEAWIRYSRSDTSAVENLAGWLTTVVARVCLDMLRSRRSRREEPLSSEPSTRRVIGQDASDPAQEAVLADSVGLALMVVLHDLFAVPFDQIAPIVERSPTATKKLASRARQRVQGTPTIPDTDLDRHRHVVDAFIAAARGGDVTALLAVLDPDVVRRADRLAVSAGVPLELRGAQAVAEETRTNAPRARHARPALVDGAVGVVVAPRGQLVVALRLAIWHDRITRIDVIADPARLDQLDLAVLAS